MKFQNIKNPEIIADLLDDWYLSDNGDNIILNQYCGDTYRYSSLAEFHREWKDYTTLLPEPIRESFKQWAKYNNIEKVSYYAMNFERSWFSKVGSDSFSYDLNTKLDYLETCKEYTVKELVGE